MDGTLEIGAVGGKVRTKLPRSASKSPRKPKKATRRRAKGPDTTSTSTASEIYFGEFMRIFDHLYSRYIVQKLKKAGKNDPDAGYLKEDWKDWVPQHFKKGPKQLRRKYFMGA